MKSAAVTGALAVVPAFHRAESSEQKENPSLYEWKFNPRPYSGDDAKKLLAPVIDAETSDWHYNTHHKGYITALNTIEKELASADRSKANANFSAIGELKRRTTWNHAGALLHDV
jgi:superoxide dismutase